MFIKDWVKVIFISLFCSICSYLLIDMLLDFRLHSLFVFICLFLIFFFIGYFIREHINKYDYKELNNLMFDNKVIKSDTNLQEENVRLKAEINRLNEIIDKLIDKDK